MKPKDPSPLKKSSKAPTFLSTVAPDDDDYSPTVYEKKRREKEKREKERAHRVGMQGGNAGGDRHKSFR